MVIGFLKGKSAIRIHRELLGHQRNFTPALHKTGGSGQAAA
jgi:hypothetical protein